ncbi:DNA-binding protein HU [Sulfitobacter donghicola DSW-25 = KCTC 12864 = JCM 14565]|nr:DNA-binding protein HU [Sulfitobacter donghicola DSW-25 = KCTC 12864 = JCM 14565]
MTEVDTSNTPRANTATPSVVDTLSPVVMSNDLRKKELFELVVERSGMKKKDVKPVVEAMLAVLGDAFGEQREMNLPPLGKLKVQRGKELPDGRALVVKLRQKTSQLNAAPKPEGDAAEE